MLHCWQQLHSNDKVFSDYMALQCRNAKEEDMKKENTKMRPALMV